MAYVDGFIIAVPDANRQAFIAHAAAAAAIFREHGALRIVEAWGDDVPDGHTTDFRRAVKCEAGETVVFAWIEWPSKEARDAGMKAVMSDGRMPSGSAPFDGRRMVFGGFEPVVDTAGGLGMGAGAKPGAAA